MLEDVPARIRAALDAFEGLLRDRAIPLGLIAETDGPRLRERHVLDCLRVVEVLTEQERILCDIGSGAGLPGLVIAIVRPDARVTLVEPRHRAAGFLELAVDRLALKNVEVRPERIEEVTLSADVATTRAFAPLERSWEAALRVLRPGGRLFYFAGEGLTDPAAAAEAVAGPEAPSSVEVARVIADFSPLVMMTRARDDALGNRPGGETSTRG